MSRTDTWKRRPPCGLVLLLAACDTGTYWRASALSARAGGGGAMRPGARAAASARQRPRAALDSGAGSPKVSEKAARFEAMLDRCRAYTSFELAALRDQPRMQRLLTGVIAGARDADVVPAFTVLYEDFLPLRLGGDLIFKLLDDRLRAAVAARNGAFLRGEYDAEACAVEPRSGECEEEVQLSAVKALFDVVDADGSGELSRDEVIGSGFHALLKQFYGMGEIDELFAAADSTTGGAAERRDLSFAQFVRAARAVGALPDAESLRLELLRNRDSREPGGAASRRQRYSDKYDAMLETFAGWTAGGEEPRLLAQVGNERLRAVLRGCFAGARNRNVVYALKILYEDHAPLRMGGDLIFQLMSRVVQGARLEEKGGSRRAYEES